MPSDAQLTYADHVGRFYARRYGFPPMIGRLLGYLSVCEPPDQTIAELAEALLASRSAITGAVKSLEAMHSVRRTRSAGERMDRVAIDLSHPQSLGLDMSEYEELRALVGEGLEVVKDASPERQATLLELAAYTEFLLAELPKMNALWAERRAQLVAAGTLPDAARRR